MADNTVPIPQGATIGNLQPQGQGQPQAVPIPQGATIGQMQNNPQQNVQTPEEGDMLSKTEDFIHNAAAGAGAALNESVAGAAKLGSKIPFVHSLADALGDALGLPKMNADPYDTAMKEAKQGVDETTQTVAGKIGYGGETLLEFLTGDEALKGLSLADKLGVASKIMGVVQKSPRVMEALKAGAGLLKAAEKYPKLAQVLRESARAGLVQAGQTEVKTGGDTGEAAKEGGVAAGVTTALGGAGAVLGKVAGKFTNAGNTLEKAAEIGKQAPDKEGIVQEVRNEINAEHKRLGEEFERNVNNRVKTPLVDETLPVADSPVQKAAKNIQGNPELQIQPTLKDAINAPVPGVDPRIQTIIDKLVNPESEQITAMHPKEYLKRVGADASSILKSEADDDVVGSLREAMSNGEKVGKEIPHPHIEMDDAGNIIGADGRHRALAALLSGEESIPVKMKTKIGDFDINSLINLRQELGKIARSYDYGDPSARMSRKLIEGIDDSIEHMASESGNSAVADAYKDIRANYRDRIHYIDSTPIDALRTKEAGKQLNDVGQYLLSGNKSLDKINTLRQVIGDRKMDVVGESVLKNFLADFTKESGKPDLGRFVAKWDKIPDNVKEAMFGSNLQKFENLAKDIKSAKNTVTLTKTGLVAGLASWNPLAWAALLSNYIFGKASAANLLEEAASNPNLQKQLGSMVGFGGKMAQAVKKPAAIGAANTLRNVYSATEPMLASNEQ